MQKSANQVNQQKKILKFQMKMQAMQQEKQKQVQNLQPVKMSDGQKFVNTLASTNTGIDMFNPTGTPKKPALLPNPVGMPNISNMQNPTGIGVRNQNPNTCTPVSVSHTQAHQPEFVETVFYLDHDHNSFLPSKKKPQTNAPSTNIQLTNPKKTQQPQKKKIKDPWSIHDQYGFKYPKGIPKSFLLQQQHQQQNANSQTTVSDGPIWPSYQQNNAPMMIQSPVNDTTNAASPMLAQTDAQGEIAQPYSPSELYTDLDQSHSQGSESPQAKPESGANTKQQLLFWGPKFQEALQEAKLKYQIWAKHNKPRHGPYYKEMNESRKVFKARKKWLKKQKEIHKEGLAASGSENCDDSESSELSQSGQKRLSAFRRLGPQKQPKKPKLTISLTVNEDQEVREVVDETEDQEEITPVHLREDIILSADETVMKYLKAWPWKRNVVLKRSVTARNSKTVMMLEREQMEEIYDKETLFVQVTVKGYPPSWKKEQVLDLLMDNIRGYSFIPCFIEFNHEECKFLTLRCRSALLSLHKCGFIIRKEDVELMITLGQTELTLNQLDFVPRLILRKRLNMCVESKTKLDLTAFTLNEDISHFIYFPLNRLNNQVEIVQVQSDVTWAYLTDLNLSHNRISSLDGFDLEQSTPKLKHLNLSYNCIEKITHLLKCRQLPLKTIHLEGNPLCMDYRDPDQYVKVVKMMFSGVMMIDDIPVKLKGDMPKINRNYCPSDARELVDKFLEVYFPLLDGDIEHRAMLQDMYEDHVTMTITYNYKLAFGPIYRCFKTLFQNARQLEQDRMDIVKGSMAVVKTIAGWPHTEHDPFTFTVDVLFHNETTTILRIDGVLKLTRESLADDEYLLAFSRTLVLHTRDYAEYKIQMEMLHWSAPTGAYAKSAFAVTAVKTKQMNPKIDSTTDKKLQGELLKIFMKLTSMDRKLSERCLEIKKWNLKEALDHFAKLLKLDNLELLDKGVS